MQVRDRGHRPPGRILREMCVYSDYDDHGERRLVIRDPPTESQAVTEVVNDLFTERPEDLSNSFQRCATLLRIAIFLLATVSEDTLTRETRQIGTRFNTFYRNFCRQLQRLMMCSFEMYEMFKTACYYYDRHDEARGSEMLVDLRGRSDTGQSDLEQVAQELRDIQTEVQHLIARLDTRRAQLGNTYEVYVNCLSECTTGILSIHSFLADQENLIETLKMAFNLERHAAPLQARLDGATFRELINDDTPGGFMYELHRTILRCVAAKKISGSYARALRSPSATFNQMVSASPSQAIARQNVIELIRSYNEAFPAFVLNRGIDGMIAAADWGQPPPPPRQDSSGWPCTIL